MEGPTRIVGPFFVCLYRPLRGQARERAGTGKTKKGPTMRVGPPTSPLSQQSMLGNRTAPDRFIALLVQFQHRHLITLGIEQLAILEVVAITQR